MLAPSLPGLGALGVEDAVELLGDPPGMQAPELVERSGRRTLYRCALPGTPELGGTLTARPRGAGTGHVLLHLWSGVPWRDLVPVRLTHPRSASPAERVWNLMCHLRAHGVATPEPLAAGAAGAGLFARDSFLVTRELEGFVDLATWLDSRPGPTALRRLRVSLARTLEGILRAGLELPDLTLADLFVSGGAAEEAGACSLADAPPVAVPRRNRLPTVALARLEHGRLRRELDEGALRRTLGGLVRELAGRGEVRLLATLSRTLRRARGRELARRLVSPADLATTRSERPAS